MKWNELSVKMHKIWLYRCLGCVVLQEKSSGTWGGYLRGCQETWVRGMTSQCVCYVIFLRLGSREAWVRKRNGGKRGLCVKEVYWVRQVVTESLRLSRAGVYPEGFKEGARQGHVG